MKRKIVFPLLMILIITACAPAPQVTSTPLPTSFFATEPATLIQASPTLPIQTTFVPSATLAPPIPANTATSIPSITAMNNPYAVVLVLPSDVLNIRSGAGVSNNIIGTLQPTDTNLNRTGPAASANGDRWVEIQNPSGGTGWVNANFLTEQVSSSTFCSDTRVTELLNNTKSALINSNGELLSSLISPVHGLDLRLWRYGTVANYSPEEAKFVFESTYEVSWGPAPGSGEETKGSFSVQPLPKLKEVFSSSYTSNCNNTLDLATFSVQPVPAEYTNINFYTIYKPGTEQYGGLDWRAWILGVEYVGGKPTLFSLIHFQWEP
ncbi:MAG TPA: SH3 domain-containing protein [Anaerolineales bacterium]|mgnify:FL=1|nr:SH3 domain-containing protein [Anaerolineales bacterium]